MKDALIEINIQFYGHLKNKAGTEELKINVPKLLTEAVNNIYNMLKEKYGITSPILLILNESNVNALLKNEKNKTLNNGDVIKVVPLFGGG